MSLISDYIDQYPKQTKRLLGIDYQSLEQLVIQAELINSQIKAEVEQAKDRIIASGGGRKTKLFNRDQILLTLSYLRQHSTFQCVGIHFRVSESSAQSIFHYWLDILAQILPPSLLAQVEDQESEEESIQELLTQFELLVDSSEQTRQRPQDKKEGEKYYSGYKQMYSFKNYFTVLPEAKDIVDVKIGEPGPKADINLFRERQTKFNSQQTFKGDKAFVGEPNISTPHKKFKNQELTEMQKEEDKELSSQRVFVEHMIRLIKIFRIGQQRFRLRPRHYEKVISVVCGLVRFRIGTMFFPKMKNAIEIVANMS